MIAITVSRIHARTQHRRYGGREYVEISRKWSAIGGHLPYLDLVRKRERKYRTTMAANYDRRHAVVEGTELSAGDRIWIPDLQTAGNVIRNLQSPRSVLIETPRSIGRRNRRMTRRLQQPTSDDAIYGMLIVIDLHDPVSVPSDTDLDNPAAIEHAAPAGSSRKSNR